RPGPSPADGTPGGRPGSASGPGDPLDTLTRRERDVAQLVARGLSNARIAGSLGLSEGGVKSTVNRILTRLGLENRVQIAILVLATEPATGARDTP
ncbi:helix-turn-helix domain-containing protein, partial [Streptomyces resistomycificus]